MRRDIPFGSHCDIRVSILVDSSGDILDRTGDI